MASLPPPSPTIATATATTTFSTPPSSYPFFKNTSQTPTIEKHNHYFRLLCKAKNDPAQEYHPTTTSKNVQTSLEKFDRRNLLIGLGGYGAASLVTNSPAFASPVLPPDVTNCGAKDFAPVSKISRKIKKSSLAMAAETTTFPVTLNKVVRVIVPRSKKKRGEEEEEVLVLDGIEVRRDVYVKFDVLINDEGEPEIGPGNTEFAGSFVNVPRTHKNSKKTNSCLRLGISELLEDLGVDKDEGVIVTLVPRNGADNVIIGGAKIEFES